MSPSGWAAPGLVVHAGFHFSANVEARQAAALARLQRAVAYAEQVGPRLLLENLNVEPADAEVHYMMAFGSLEDKLAACWHEA